MVMDDKKPMHPMQPFLAGFLLASCLPHNQDAFSVKSWRLIPNAEGFELEMKSGVKIVVRVEEKK